MLEQNTDQAEREYIMAKHYYISFNAGGAWSEIFPSNDPVATKQQIEGTRVWREEVDELRLPKTTNSAVYTTLHAYFIDKTKFDDEVEIEIYSGVRATGTLYWQGLFSISDTKDDFEKTVAILNPLRINDNYRIVLEQAEAQHELDVEKTILEQDRIGYSEPLTIDTNWVNGTIGTAFATLIASGGVITQASAGAGPGYEAYLPTTQAVAIDDIVIIDVSAFTSNTTPTFDFMVGAGTSVTDEGPKQIATGLMAWTMSSAGTPRIWLNAPPGDSSCTFTTRVIQTENDRVNAGELLITFIENYITTTGFMYLTGYAGDVVSTFFNNDALPTGAPSSISTIMTAEPNGNYVRGTATNELNKTEIGLLRKWFSITESVSFKLSFNDIMGHLRDMFQVYWFIDADGKFRIEHEMYFVAQVADSTPIVLVAQDEVDARVLNYNKARIASTESFSWAQASNQDFVGNNIVYNNFETTNNSSEYSLSNITTDIKYIIDNLADASNSGLGVYQCNILTGITGDDIYEINISTGVLSSALISNAAFSWANLHEKYWSWSRMAEDATVNAGAVTMDSAIRFLEQANVRFFYATAIDPFTLITAQLTGAAPIEIRRDLETDFVEFILGFDPYKL